MVESGSLLAVLTVLGSWPRASRGAEVSRGGEQSVCHPRGQWPDRVSLRSGGQLSGVQAQQKPEGWEQGRPWTQSRGSEHCLPMAPQAAVGAAVWPPVPKGHPTCSPAPSLLHSRWPGP